MSSADVPAAVPPQEAPTDRARYCEVLRIGEFRTIFAANIVSMLGTVMAAVVLTVLVYDKTKAPALAASVMAISFLPYAIGGALFGAAADRLPPRRVLVTCDLASGLLVGCMVIPAVPVPGLLGLLLGTTLIAPVYQAVRSALMPDVLPPGPPYILGRAMMRMVAQSAQIAGYGAGGLLLAVLSPRGVLAADALSFAASAVLLRTGTHPRSARAAKRGSMAHDSLAGLRRVLAYPPTRTILLFTWLIPACEVAPEALAAPYTVHIGQPARSVGFLLAALPVGTVLADAVVARLLPTRLQRRIMLPAALLIFVPMTLFGVSPSLPLAVALLVVSGLGSAWAAGIDGLILEATPPDLRRRTLAVMGAGLMFIQGAGFALWGTVGQFLPVTVVIPVAAASGSILALTLRPTRSARSRPSASAEGSGSR